MAWGSLLAACTAKEEVIPSVKVACRLYLLWAFSPSPRVLLTCPAASAASTCITPLPCLPGKALGWVFKPQTQATSKPSVVPHTLQGPGAAGHSLIHCCHQYLPRPTYTATFNCLHSLASPVIGSGVSCYGSVTLSYSGKQHETWDHQGACLLLWVLEK